MNFVANSTARPNLRRALAFLAIVVAGLLAAHALDPVVYRQFHNHEASVNGLPKMFRGAGYIPLWIVVASALMLIDTAKWTNLGLAGVLQRGLPIILTVVLAGIMTEGAKCLIHRGRPPEEGWNGHYLFRPFNNGIFVSESMGMPSSHAGVAFAAAWILVRLYPRGTPIWVLVGLGCAWQRLLDRAHFFSDLIAAMFAAYVAAWLVWHSWRRWIGFQELDGHHRVKNTTAANNSKLSWYH